ncbi:hypothetical protein COV93_00630 [Candidatus Woesearchaeota archaeon CG11_big_fil_rev_8_21_14_0_20_43_8]|nr:MAG: hypothetical protein COV93_00630 [Candidatus Woesearchaeota archaeon CG11_big_fil_rev_8_21_14_0_20_43_8]
MGLAFCVFIVYQDIDTIKDNMQKTRLYLLLKDDSISEGFYVAPDIADIKSKDEFFNTDVFNPKEATILTGEHLAELDALFMQDAFKQMLGNHSRMYVIKEDAFYQSVNKTFTYKMLDAIDNDVGFILDSYRKGLLSTYPITPFYKMVAIVPEFIFNSLITTEKNK